MRSAVGVAVVFGIFALLACTRAPPGEAPVAPGEVLAPEPIIEAPQAEPLSIRDRSWVRQEALPTKPWYETSAPSATTTVTFEPAGKSRTTDVRTVTVRLTVSAVPEPTEVALEFLAPGGTVYERRAGSLAKVPGEQTLAFELPVAGTVIDSSSLTGVWQAQFRINGAKVLAQNFELTP